MQQVASPRLWSPLLMSVLLLFLLHFEMCHPSLCPLARPRRTVPARHSPALGGFDFMAFVCRWRQFDACNLSCPRFPSIFSIGRATRKQRKNEVSDMLRVASGTGSGKPERERERYGGMRFIVYMFYVISNLCSNSNRRRAKPPQHCIHTCSCLKWQHPLAT